MYIHHWYYIISINKPKNYFFKEIYIYKTKYEIAFDLD